LLTRDISSKEDIDKSDTDIKNKMPSFLLREEDSNNKTKYLEK